MTPGCPSHADVWGGSGAESEDVGATITAPTTTTGATTTAPITTAGATTTTTASSDDADRWDQLLTYTRQHDDVSPVGLTCAPSSRYDSVL